MQIRPSHVESEAAIPFGTFELVIVYVYVDMYLKWGPGVLHVTFDPAKYFLTIKNMEKIFFLNI